MAIRYTKKKYPYSHWEIVKFDNGDRIRIVPERGGLITEWYCNGREILYFDQERFTQKTKSVRGGIPILFPICGNIPGNCLKLENNQFFINQHGFARDAIWQIKPNLNQNSVILSFSDNKITRLSYPFSFLIEMEVRLVKAGIDLSISVYNRSQNEMPFSFGIHPYFKVVDLKNTQIEGLPIKCLDQLNIKEAITAEELERLSDGIDIISGPSKSVALIDVLADTRLVVQHQEPMDLTVVWTDPPRQMICVEPWTSPREALISGERIISLEPGAIKTLSCGFRVN